MPIFQHHVLANKNGLFIRNVLVLKMRACFDVEMICVSEGKVLDPVFFQTLCHFAKEKLTYEK